MQFIDHKILASYIIRHSGNMGLEKHRYAFTLGSVMPDLDIGNYVKGFFKGHPLKMHFTVNSTPVIRKKLERLHQKEKRKLTWADYYRLGVLTHFLADAFTFPHNEAFQGSMLEHAEYEAQELHPAFQQAARREIEELNFGREKNLWELFCSAHSEYLREEPSPWRDISYIVSVCRQVCEQLIPEENMGVERKIRFTAV